MNEENKSYKLTCFLSPLLKQEKLDESVQKIKQTIADNQGTVKEETIANVVKKNLPYKIQKHQEAFYLNLNFLLPVLKMNKLCRQLNLEKKIIRYLITIQKQPREYKKTIKSKLIRETIDSKMIDKIEPLGFKRKEPEPIPDKSIKTIQPSKEKVKIKELDKKLDEILNQ